MTRPGSSNSITANTWSPDAAVRLLVADDHQLMREGLRRLLAAAPELQIVAEAANGHEALDMLQRHVVDVAVLDLTMPGMPGMDLIQRVKTAHPRLPVLVLTMHAEEQYAVRAFRHGANGYITKDSAGGELIQAIRKIAAGGSFVTDSLAEHLALSLGRPQDVLPHTRLSNREFEVFRRIGAGQRLTDIAKDLNLSIKTVSTHKAHILEKLELDSTAALVRYGIQHQLFDEVDTPR